MILINGKKIDHKNQQEQNTNKKPSINEILQYMQTNYDNRVYVSQTPQPQHETPQNNHTENQNNLLLSVLPALLNAKQNTTQTQNIEQSDILKTLLKNLNNPMLEKLFELLPLFNKKSKTQQAEVSNKKSETKIDSLTKTDDYHNS